MLTAVVMLKTLVAVAGLSLLGQGVLVILAGAGRERNVFFRILAIISAPAIKGVRLITPRALVPDRYIGAAAFCLLAGLYLALILQQRALCLADLRQPLCRALTTEYVQRCQSGQAFACEVLQRGGVQPPERPAGKSDARRQEALKS
jgi:hypothetical protein